MRPFVIVWLIHWKWTRRGRASFKNCAKSFVPALQHSQLCDARTWLLLVHLPVHLLVHHHHVDKHIPDHLLVHHHVRNLLLVRIRSLQKVLSSASIARWPTSWCKDLAVCTELYWNLLPLHWWPWIIFGICIWAFVFVFVFELLYLCLSLHAAKCPSSSGV